LGRLKRILVGVDGSQAGYHALSEAIRLAQWSRGWVAALAVVPSYEGDLSLVGVRDIKALITGPCKAVLSRAIETAESLGAHVDVKCEMGEPHEGIVEHAVTKRCDIVVLGRSRRSATAGFLRGSTASKIIRSCPIQVLVVPEDASLGWERILVVSDNVETREERLEQAMALAGTYGGRLTVFSIAKGKSRGDFEISWEEAPEAQNHEFRASQTRREHVRGVSGIHKTMIERVARDNIRLIVMGKSGRGRLGFLKKYLLQSPFQDLFQDLWHKTIRSAPCPVLVLPS
jgi:nucleotide-binding universal stress UspA family protein